LIDFSVFQGKRILVTGHSGFKGSWLVAILEKAGATVRGLSLPPIQGSHFEILGYMQNHSGGEFIDIRDFAKVEEIVNEFNPEIIFHLAAQPLVRESFLNTRETFEVNLMGGVNILEATRQAQSLKAVVFITSDKAYENVEWEWGYRENDKLGGIDPYSASKGAVEMVVSSYVRSILDNSKVRVVTARAGNVIGGGDWSKDRIVPDIVRAVVSSKKVEIRNPNSTRPWQHVLEPLSGYLLLAQRLIEGSETQDSYNFGPNLTEQKTVLQLAEGLIGIFGRGAIELIPDRERLHEAGLLQLNCERAKKDLGWAPRWDFDETLQMTGDWYRKLIDGKDPSLVTHNQISSFFSELR
jgi:CDP-glucose 4,6-dehydratase